LSGITGILYEPQSLIPNTAPSLRAFGDKYVQAHGYNESSILCIHNAFEHSDDIDDVTNYLSQGGLSKREGNFIWTLINGWL
jgi:hypothetical protein